MEEVTLPHRHGEGQNIAQLQAQLDQVEHFSAISEVFRQLDDATRLRIFWLLCHCEECVLNLSAMMRMSSPAVSHHLRPLKASGLVVSRRVGKEVYYRAADTAQSRLLHRMIEQLAPIACPGAGPGLGPDGGPLPAPQTEGPCTPQQIAREIHDHCLQHLGQRVTIESLARQYHINPTTLKSAFRAVYGSSLAAHIKQHRMEEAARLLRQTPLPIAEVARAVGYDSQSRFSAAFKAHFKLLPREYRRLQS